MSDAWKQFESLSAALFGEERCWANSGARVDFPRHVAGAPVYGQCKNVKALSLNELTALAEEMALVAENAERPALGVVCVKTRRGRGQSSQPIVVMTFSQFEKLRDCPTIMEEIIRRRTNRKETHGASPA